MMQKSFGQRLSFSVRKHWFLYLLLLFPLCWVVIFKYIPIYGLSMAFQNFSIRKGYFRSDWVGLAHFRRFFESPMFWKLASNTVTLSLYDMVVGFICPIVFSLLVNETRNTRLKKTVQMVSFLPYFISTVVTVAMLQQMFSLTGVFSQITAIFGLKAKSFFGTAATFRHMHVWSGVWSGMGYGAVIYIAALAKIDVQLYEAAMLDGANRLQKILHIDLPGIAPTMIILLILRMSGIMNVGFEKVFLMQTNINIGISQVISTYVYQVGLIGQQYSFSAAVGFLNSVINVLFLLITNAVARRVSETSLW